VRQLENICHWLTVMAPAQLVDAKDLPPELQVDGATRSGAAPTVTPSEAETTTGAPGDGAGAAASAPTPPARSVEPPRAADGARAADPDWVGSLEQRARELLQSGQPMVWDTLTREFEAQLIRSALEMTRGRRIEAAHKLGIGRNTITRKIQELGLDEK